MKECRFCGAMIPYYGSDSCKACDEAAVKPGRVGLGERPFDPRTLHGISFFDNATKREMRYIYPDAGHWSAGWIVVKNPSGEWMTLRKATDADIAALNRAVVEGHHQ